MAAATSAAGAGVSATAAADVSWSSSMSLYVNGRPFTLDGELPTSAAHRQPDAPRANTELGRTSVCRPVHTLTVPSPYCTLLCHRVLLSSKQTWSPRQHCWSSFGLWASPAPSWDVARVSAATESPAMPTSSLRAARGGAYVALTSIVRLFGSCPCMHVCVYVYVPHARDLVTGGCGACTVMVSHRLPDGSVHHRSVNACLAPLASCDSTAVTTVEGIGSVKSGLHPVQERLGKLFGSQVRSRVHGMVHGIPTCRCTVLVVCCSWLRDLTLAPPARSHSYPATLPLTVRLLHARVRDGAVHGAAQQPQDDAA